jgi:hypothetical protein
MFLASSQTVLLSAVMKSFEASAAYGDTPFLLREERKIKNLVSLTF